MVMRKCTTGRNDYDCYQGYYNEFAQILSEKHPPNKSVRIGTSCDCKYDFCNNHPWDVLIETKSKAKAGERKIASEKTDTKTTSAMIPEGPTGEQSLLTTENTRNNVWVLHTDNQLLNMFTILILFIISLITQY